MVRPTALRLENFRSFASASIRFPTSGLVLIEGRNPDTGDASGSGKSTVLLGIAYALDILPAGFPATELRSWRGGTMQVVLELDVDGESVSVGRGAKTFVSRGDRTVTGAKPVAEELRKILGLPPEILAAITYRPQGAPGLFLSRTPAAKAEFLVPLLGLDSIETAVDDATVQATTAQALLDSHERNRVSHSQSVENYRQKRVEADPDISGLEVAAATAAIEAQEASQHLQEAKENVARVQAAVEARHAQTLAESQRMWELLTAKRLEAVALEGARKQAHGAQQEQYQHVIYRAQDRLNKVERQLRERERLQDALKSLSAGNCQTCLRTWDQSQTEAERIRAQVEALSVDIALGPAALAEKKTAEEALKSLVWVPDPNLAKLEEIELELARKMRAQYAAKQQDPELVEAQASIPGLEAKQIRQQRLSYDAQQELAVARETIKGLAKARSRWAEGLASAEADLAATEAKVAEFKLALAAEKDFAEALGRSGFLGLIFEEVLQEIAAEANTRLARLANVSHVCIGFRTESQTQKGTTRRSISTVVYVGGQEASYQSGLSGGQQTSVEQVVDMAVMVVIQRRTGKVPGWMCLDEVFNGMGRVSKETSLEVLREFAADKLVLVIDHGSEFREMFTQTLVVENQNGVSTVVP